LNVRPLCEEPQNAILLELARAETAEIGLSEFAASLRRMERAAIAAKAASGVAQAKPRVNATLAATSKAIQIGRRQPVPCAKD
jgi:hypothetical protein